jgi:hypothetical protein
MTKHCAHAQSAAIALLLVVASPHPAHAAWPSDSLLNVPVCTVQNDQSLPASVGDGAGGVIVAWMDARGGFVNGLYAQHVLGSGSVDPTWPADGRFLCQPSPLFRGQQNATMVSDGAGGAIVVWQEARSFLLDVYAQHVQANGEVDPAWPENGLPVCASSSDQYVPKCVPDGAGGAIVAWQDGPSGNANIYAQHVRLDGTLDPAWPVDGAPVCAAFGDQDSPVLVSDGSGGAIVTWNDYRSYLDLDIYAQHIRASGELDTAWPTNGLSVCAEANDQKNPTITSDGAGGAIIAWWDNRVALFDVYAQHVTSAGAVDWNPSGVPVCTFEGDQSFPAIVADSSGGAIIAWVDGRPSGGTFAHHVLATGALDPAWPADGRSLSPNVNTQPPAMVSDTSGGAIVVWTDYRSDDGSYTNGNIYAQRVRASGVVDPLWPEGGRAMCAAPRDQIVPVVSADGAGGAIAVWQDYRIGFYDIYAQRVQANGELGGDATTAALLSIADINTDGRSVRVRWFVSGGPVDARVYRRTVDTDWSYVADVAADGNGFLGYDDPAVEPGQRYGYRVGLISDAVEGYFGETWITVPASRLALEGPWPNPADRHLVVSLSLARREPAVLELIDLSGRSVLRRDVPVALGNQLVRLESGRRLAPGVYMVRLTQGEDVVSRKACVMR